MLNKIPAKRLGANGAYEVKSHQFFDGIIWDDLATKKVQAPFRPNIVNELDTSNFADEFTKQVAADSPAVVPNGENLFRVSKKKKKKNLKKNFLPKMHQIY